MDECETLADLLHNPPEHIIQGLNFLFPWLSAGPKTQEIRNSGAEFLISVVSGPTKNTGNKKFRG